MKAIAHKKCLCCTSAAVVIAGAAVFLIRPRALAPWDIEMQEVAACFRDWSRPERFSEVLSRISALTDAKSRTSCLKAAAAASVSGAIMDSDAQTRSVMTHDYLFWVILPMASSLKENGVSEETLSDYVIGAWTAFDELRKSFASCADKRGGNRMSDMANSDYTNACILFERSLLALVFDGMPEGAEARFRARWKAAFRPESADADAGAKSR